MKRVCCGVLALALSSCAVDVVETRRRVRGPVKEVGLIDAGGGHVRYALKGPKFLVSRRREKAFKKMAKYCEGEKLFRIRKEYAKEDVETPFNSENLEARNLMEAGHYKVEKYRHIIFECVKK